MNNIYSMLGLCMKAGKLICGTDACIDSIKTGSAYAIVVANDASNNTKEKFNKLATDYSVDIVLIGEKELISKSVGKIDKAVFVITDNGLANKILMLVRESKGAI